MLRRFGVSLALLCVVTLALGAAGAATAKRAVFSVTFTATLTKDWTLTETADDDCAATTRFAGQWRLQLASRRAARVVATAPPGRGQRVRFSGAEIRALFGTARQTGSTTTGRSVRCGEEGVQRDCTREQRAVRNARARFGSPRAGILRFHPLQGAAGVRSLTASCGNEPRDVRAIRTDLTLADGPLSAADVFARDVPRFFVSGNTEQVTTIEGDIEGRVTERVRWTLTFRRLAR
jgi:hypothetical protein